MKQFGPDVICPTSHVVQFTHRPGNEGPFFCMACGATDHAPLEPIDFPEAWRSRLLADLQKPGYVEPSRSHDD